MRFRIDRRTTVQCLTVVKNLKMMLMLMLMLMTLTILASAATAAVPRDIEVLYKSALSSRATCDETIYRRLHARNFLIIGQEQEETRDNFFIILQSICDGLPGTRNTLASIRRQDTNTYIARTNVSNDNNLFHKFSVVSSFTVQRKQIGYPTFVKYRGLGGRRRSRLKLIREVLTARIGDYSIPTAR